MNDLSINNNAMDTYKVLNIFIYSSVDTYKVLNVFIYLSVDTYKVLNIFIFLFIYVYHADVNVHLMVENVIQIKRGMTINDGVNAKIWENSIGVSKIIDDSVITRDKL